MHIFGFIPGYPMVAPYVLKLAFKNIPTPGQYEFLWQQCHTINKCPTLKTHEQCHTRHHTIQEADTEIDQEPPLNRLAMFDQKEMSGTQTTTLKKVYIGPMNNNQCSAYQICEKVAFSEKGYCTLNIQPTVFWQVELGGGRVIGSDKSRKRAQSQLYFQFSGFGCVWAVSYFTFKSSLSALETGSSILAGLAGSPICLAAFLVCLFGSPMCLTASPICLTKSPNILVWLFYMFFWLS